MVNVLASLLKILNSESSPAQVATAAIFGLMAGFLPILHPVSLLLVFLVCLLRVNAGAFLFCWSLSALLGTLLSPVFHEIGKAVLTAPILNGPFTALYGTSAFRVARFHHTVVMGGFLCSLLFAAPFWFLVRGGVARYRKGLLSWVKKTRLGQILLASRVYAAYRKFS